MADQTLIRNYLLDARAAVGADRQSQYDYLEVQRGALSIEVNGGDIAVTGSSFEGASSNFARGKSATDRLAALIAAMEQIQQLISGQASSSRPGIITPRFGGILN